MLFESHSPDSVLEFLTRSVDSYSVDQSRSNNQRSRYGQRMSLAFGYRMIRMDSTFLRPADFEDEKDVDDEAIQHMTIQLTRLCRVALEVRSSRFYVECCLNLIAPIDLDDETSFDWFQRELLDWARNLSNSSARALLISLQFFQNDQELLWRDHVGMLIQLAELCSREFEVEIKGKCLGSVTRLVSSVSPDRANALQLLCLTVLRAAPYPDESIRILSTFLQDKMQSNGSSWITPEDIESHHIRNLFHEIACSKWQESRIKAFCYLVILLDFTQEEMQRLQVDLFNFSTSSLEAFREVTIVCHLLYSNQIFFPK
eukprot:TRINITY_DN7379_c0_g1_i2.p1 TRINITY_DN7379_c0_g1~~TRINITY_DN7379_c0_g1_i2.p1  ORF type:complete len:315 (+),score=58.86 TRINITY_DN7379_c0_g1_i2:162-1106(+)